MDRHILDLNHFGNPNILLRDLKKIFNLVFLLFISVLLNAQEIFIVRKQTKYLFTFLHCKYENYSGCDKEVSFIDHYKALDSRLDNKNSSLSMVKVN